MFVCGSDVGKKCLQKERSEGSVYMYPAILAKHGTSSLDRATELVFWSPSAPMTCGTQTREWCRNLVTAALGCLLCGQKLTGTCSIEVGNKII